MRALLLLLVLILTGCLPSQKTFEKSYSQQLRIDPLKNYILKSEKKINNAKLKEFYLDHKSLFVHEESFRHFSKAEVDLKNKIDGVLQLYKSHDTPYAGFISKSVQCPLEFLPKEFNFSDDEKIFGGLELYSNERKTFGSCMKRDIKFKSFYMVAICKKQKLMYQLTLFLKPDQTDFSLENLGQSIVCL